MSSNTGGKSNPLSNNADGGFWGSKGRGGGIRTHGLFVPNEARYQTALRPDILACLSDSDWKTHP